MPGSCGIRTSPSEKVAGSSFERQPRRAWVDMQVKPWRFGGPLNGSDGLRRTVTWDSPRLGVCKRVGNPGLSAVLGELLNTIHPSSSYHLRQPLFQHLYTRYLAIKSQSRLMETTVFSVSSGGYVFASRLATVPHDPCQYCQLKASNSSLLNLRPSK